ncbi:DUF2621 family protein [Tenuibacillus multivorans]|uniref:DUF2621 domain-containing protein n=1 Tax=Tenuibacillus multivorans TaxID=237069 RepID=A0A1H0CHF8_9BACI|nr:DUF2621 family protein [Tenuibacillus multivorans]GEL76295.1 hypothetical protein TMU01_05300 [Tenuibacillus multivorans]SDN57289.1 Protein of unknown function [Tenuibacillus multivorans]
MSETVGYLMILWGLVMISLLGIGGFFMFRKFLKKLPKEDGKSIIDWEEYYVEQTVHLWGQDEKKLLNELVEPVPQLFRDVAKQKIAAKIGEVALQRNKQKISLDVIIEGYILATPKRDHKFLIKRLNEKNIDFSPYEHLLEKQ